MGKANQTTDPIHNTTVEIFDHERRQYHQSDVRRNMTPVPSTYNNGTAGGVVSPNPGNTRDSAGGVLGPHRGNTVTPLEASALAKDIFPVPSAYNSTHHLM